MSNYKDLTILGKTVRTPIHADQLETFPCPDGVTFISFDVEEFTSMCPVTGQPDYSTVHISYLPKERCLESKSLKLYMQSFRNEGIFCEALAAKIASDLFTCLEPDQISVTVVQSARGGISTTASARFPELGGNHE